MISIIIPLYKEHNVINATLSALSELESQHLITEILLVQSEGETYSVPTLISSKRQRSTQMNLGAQQAQGEILLFLHADTQLPVKALSYIMEQRAGAFSLKFDSTSFAAKIIGFLTTIRSKIFSLPYGDQAFFMPKSEFEKVRGFDDVPILEDVLMAKKIPLPILNHHVISSFRRYQEQGILKTVLKHRYIMLRYFFGSSPEDIYKRRKF